MGNSNTYSLTIDFFKCALQYTLLLILMELMYLYYATMYDLIANLQYLSTTRLLFTNRGKRQEITNIITIEQVRWPTYGAEVSKTHKRICLHKYCRFLVMWPSKELDLFFAFDNHGLNVTIRLVKEHTLKIIFVDSCVYECYCVE